MDLIRSWATVGAMIGFVAGLMMTLVNLFRGFPVGDSGVGLELRTLCPVYAWGVANGYNDTTQLIAMTLVGNAVVYAAGFAVLGAALFVLKKVF